MAATASSVSPPSPVSPLAVRLMLQAEQWQQLQLQQLSTWAVAFSQPLAMEIKWKPAKVSRDDFTP